MKQDEKRLFDLIEATGETLDGSIHIIDMIKEQKYQTDEREGKYRIYHKDNICFDVEKEYVCEPNEIKDYDEVWPDGFNYTFYAEWEGFKNDFTLLDAIKLIKTNTHLPSEC